jgi:AcrR family transcriptional regulator
MEDIVKTTGVSRYGLYGTFGNKRELFEQALEQYAEGMGKRAGAGRFARPYPHYFH